MGLPLPLPQTSHRVFFPLQFDSAIGQTCGLLHEPASVTGSWKRKGGALCAEGELWRPWFYVKEKERWVLASFPHFYEDLTEALLELTAALSDSAGDAASPSPFLATSESAHAVQSPWDWLEGLRAERPLRKPSPELQQRYSVLSPTLYGTLTPFSSGLWPSSKF